MYVMQVFFKPMWYSDEHSRISISKETSLFFDGFYPYTLNNYCLHDFIKKITHFYNFRLFRVRCNNELKPNFMWASDYISSADIRYIVFGEYDSIVDCHKDYFQMIEKIPFPVVGNRIYTTRDVMRPYYDNNYRFELGLAHWYTDG